jgi:DNA polymerase-3 subunit epsilon
LSKIFKMNIHLKRPLAIFDLETTGINITQDRIVEIAILKLNVDGSEERYEQKVNPEMEMSEEIIAIHGITNEELKSKPTFKELTSDLKKFIEGCDFGGFNSNRFDVPVLVEEMLRVDEDFDISDRKFVDVQNIFHKMEKRTLAAAYQFYCKKELINAHSAMADTVATWEVLNAQIERYKDLSGDVDFLAEFSTNHDFTRVDFANRLARNEKEEVVYNFGKHRGKTIEEINKIEPGYYGWMLHADFPLDTKQCLKKEMNRIKAIKNLEKQAKQQAQEEQMENKLNQLKNKFK